MSHSKASLQLLVSSINSMPREITSPHKNYPGITKTLFTHLSRLHVLLNDWFRVQDKGTKICKVISALRLHEFDIDVFPTQLSPLIESLQDALKSLNIALEGIEILKNQLQALTQLQTIDQPVVFTWTACKIFDSVNNIYKHLKKEYVLKEVITENIAHCRDEKLIEVYVSSWEFPVYFDIKSTIYLFEEVGLNRIT